MSDAAPQRLRLTGPAASREAALDRLHVWTEVHAVLEDDGADVVSCSGSLPDLADLDGLCCEVLPPPTAAELAVTGLEDDRAFEAAPGVWVRPPWVELPAGVVPAVELVVPRGGAFGSGEHGSTRAALGLLHAHWPAEPPAHFVDVGTGSGILALYAAVRGARGIDACDVEEASVVAARELLPVGSQVVRGTPGQLPAARAEVVVANLDGNQLREALDSVRALACSGALLVVSGMRPHETGVVEALGAPLQRLEVEGYVGFAFRVVGVAGA